MNTVFFVSKLNLGIALEKDQKYQEALALFRETLEELKNSEITDTALILRAHENLGSTYYTTGQYQKALDCYLGSLKLAESIRSIQKQSELCYHIAEAYEKMG